VTLTYTLTVEHCYSLILMLTEHWPKKVCTSWIHVYRIQFHFNLLFRWTHTFALAGTQEIIVSARDEQGTNLTGLTSYIVVQEPVSNLSLSGPQSVLYSE